MRSLGVGVRDLPDYSHEELDHLLASSSEPGAAGLGSPGAARRCLHEALDAAHRAYEATVPSTRFARPPQDSRDHSISAAQISATISRELGRTLSRKLGGHKDIYSEDHAAPLFEEGDDSFDLGAFLASRQTVVPGILDSKWFATLPRLALLKKNAEARRSRAYVADSDISAWPPLWWGSSLGPQARDKFLLARKRDPGHSLASLVGYSTTFWLSHCAAGLVGIGAVFAHILLLTRLSEEKHLHFAVRYSTTLLEHIRTSIREGLNVDIDREISSENLDIVRRILNERAPPPPVRPPPPAREERALKKARPGEAIPPSPPGGEADARKLRDKIHICFDHDPQNGKTCSKGSACTKEHLDTKNPTLAARFTKASAAFQKRAAARAQASAKGG